MRTRQRKADRIVGLLLLLLMIISLGPSAASADSVTFIGSAAELIAFGESVDEGSTYAGQTVTLTNDIDMTGYMLTAIGWRSGADYSHVFQGVFEGNSHTIRGLTVVSDPHCTEIGLFSALYHATVRNLTLEGLVQTNGQSSAGGLAGRIEDSALQNVTVNITVTSSAWSYAEEDVLAAGGLAGKVLGSTTLDRCAVQGAIGATGSFDGSIYVGSFAGFVQGAGRITNCFSTADAFINDRGIYVGGFAGGLFGFSLQNCYIASHIYAGGDTVGAFAGRSETCQMENIWYDADLSMGFPAVADGTVPGGLRAGNTAQMQDSAFPAVLGDAFAPAGSWDVNQGYPVFRREQGPSLDPPETPEPTEEPTPTLEPTPEPTEEPSPTPEPTPAPTAEPTSVPESTAEPTPGPAPTVEPVPTSAPPALSPAPAASPEPPLTQAPSQVGRAPKTGDSASVLWWSVLFAVSGITVAYITRKRGPY